MNPIPTCLRSEASALADCFTQTNYAHHRCDALIPLVDKARELSRQFFLLPPYTKSKFVPAVSDGSGYRAPQFERVGGVQGTPPRETLYFTVRHPRIMPIDGLREVAQEIIITCSKLSLELLEALDECFGTHLAEIAPMNAHGLQIAHYLDGSDPERMIYPAHMDYNLLTFAIGGVEPGLEIHMCGTWSPVQLSLGEILIFGGSKISLYTKKQVRAMPHRVRGVASERISLTFSVEVDRSVVLPNGETAENYNLRIQDRMYRE